MRWIEEKNTSDEFSNTPYGILPKGQEWHNPDNLTPEQIGAKDGWRLLLKSEIIKRIPDTNIEWYGLDGKWRSGTNGDDNKFTYRTKLPIGEIDKKEPEHTSCEGCKHNTDKGTECTHPTHVPSINGDYSCWTNKEPTYGSIYRDCPACGEKYRVGTTCECEAKALKKIADHKYVPMKQALKETLPPDFIDKTGEENVPESWKAKETQPPTGFEDYPKPKLAFTFPKETELPFRWIKRQVEGTPYQEPIFQVKLSDGLWVDVPVVTE
jgi:hypothetical protein